MENRNDYEKYEDWFRIIREKCNDDTYRGTIDKGQYRGASYYVLNNDLEVVYAKETGDMRILDGGLERNIYFAKKTNAEQIALIITKAFLVFSKNVLKNANFLPKNLKEEESYSKNTFNTTNIEEGLRQAINYSANYDTKKLYMEGLNLYTKISEIVEIELMREQHDAPPKVIEADEKESEETANEEFSNNKAKNEKLEEPVIQKNDKSILNNSENNETRKEELEAFSLEELEKLKNSLLKENEKTRLELKEVNEAREKLIDEIKNLKEENDRLRTELDGAKRNKQLFSLD